MNKIKSQGPDDEHSDFTAQDLRKKLPVILKKPKVIKRYIEGKIDLDQGYQIAKISRVEERVKQAKNLLDEVSKQEVKQLEKNALNSLKQHVKRLSREVVRIENMIESLRPND